MNQHSPILVVAKPDTPQLGMLTERFPELRFVVGLSREDIRGMEQDIEVLLNWDGSREMLRSTFAALPSLRWLHTRWAGMDTIIFPELVDSDVTVTNARGVFAHSLAEFVIGAILYFAKDFRRLIRNQAANRWEQFDCEEIAGKTLGIYGYGAIGREVARLAKALGMRVFASRRDPAKSAGDPLVDSIYPSTEAEKLFAEADYVVVTAPLTPETKGAVNARLLGAMKRGAVFINIGRGPVVDEPALIAALSACRIKGAALDVFAEEPLPAEHPFFKMEHVLLSPHSADHTRTWLDDTMRFFLENLDRYLKGAPLENIVDKRLGY